MCCQIVLAHFQVVTTFLVISPDFIYHKFLLILFRFEDFTCKTFQTHLEERVLIDPSDDHVCSVDVLASGETKADVAVCFDLQFDDDVWHFHSPQQPKVLVQVNAVVPSNLVRRAVRSHESQQEQEQLRLSKHFRRFFFLQ
jgi:hypothetical protein